MDLEQLGPFRLTRRLGGGGMGAVYQAEHAELGFTRALKVLHDRTDPELVLRFRREGQAQAAVDRHPHVVRVYELGQDQGQLYLVMEALLGGTLSDRLAQGPLEPTVAASLVERLAQGLAHVHAHGILHRDLKPANVLFDQDGEPHLADFGLASIANTGSLTQSGAVLGTPSHMAPEQARADPVDERTDVFGLGAVLYHALTGRAPRSAETPLALLVLAAGEGIRPVSELRPDVPTPLQAICARALALKPADRYPSAKAFAADLRAFVRGDPLPSQANGPPWAAWLIPPGLLLLAGAVLATAILLRPDPSVEPSAPGPPPAAPAVEATVLDSALRDYSAAAPGTVAQQEAVGRVTRLVCSETRAVPQRVRLLADSLGWDEGDLLRQGALHLWAAHAICDSEPATAWACIKPLNSAATAAVVVELATELEQPAEVYLDVATTFGLAHKSTWPALRELVKPNPTRRVTRARALRELIVHWLADNPNQSYVKRLERGKSPERLCALLNIQFASVRNAKRQEILREALQAFDPHGASAEELRLVARGYAKANQRPQQIEFRRRANVQELGPELGETLTDYAYDASHNLESLGSVERRFVNQFGDLLDKESARSRADVQVELAFMLWSFNATSEARRILDNVLFEFPGHPRALRVLSFVVVRESARADAATVYRDLVLLSPKPQLLLRLRLLERVSRYDK